MLITNGKKTLEVTLREWNENECRYSQDYASEVFPDDYMEYNAQNNCYITHDLESFILMINDCSNGKWAYWDLEFEENEVITMDEVETPDDLKILE